MSSIALWVDDLWLRGTPTCAVAPDVAQVVFLALVARAFASPGALAPVGEGRGGGGSGVGGDVGVDGSGATKDARGAAAAAAAAPAAPDASSWDDAKFVPKPQKRVTNKERKAEARRLRQAKKLADAQERERRAEEEGARLRATQRRSGKLTKKQKKEERRRKKMMARGNGDGDGADNAAAEASSDRSGDGVSGSIDALATLAI